MSSYHVVTVLSGTATGAGLQGAFVSNPSQRNRHLSCSVTGTRGCHVCPTAGSAHTLCLSYTGPAQQLTNQVRGIHCDLRQQPTYMLPPALLLRGKSSQSPKPWDAGTCGIRNRKQPTSTHTVRRRQCVVGTRHRARGGGRRSGHPLQADGRRWAVAGEHPMPCPDGGSQHRTPNT